MICEILIFPLSLTLLIISRILFISILYIKQNNKIMIPVIEVLNKWYFLIIAAQIIVVIYFLKDLLRISARKIKIILSVRLS